MLIYFQIRIQIGDEFSIFKIKTKEMSVFLISHSFFFEKRMKGTVKCFKLKFEPLLVTL